MRLTVSGQRDMPALPTGTHVIVALSDREWRDSLNEQVHGLPNLHLAMHDLPFDDQIESSSEGALQYPELTHLDRLQHYLLQHRPRRVHLACHAGVSRSPALFLVTHRLITMHRLWPDFAECNEADAVAALFRARPHCHPNRRIVRQADLHFRWTLAQALHQHYQRHDPELADDWLPDPER